MTDGEGFSYKKNIAMVIIAMSLTLMFLKKQVLPVVYGLLRMNPLLILEGQKISLSKLPLLIRLVIVNSCGRCCLASSETFSLEL